MLHYRSELPSDAQHLSPRQQKILHCLIEEYLESAEPVSSGHLKKKSKLDVSGATIRNDLQELTERGYVMQPHTSAGRVPTQKGYRYFVDVVITLQKPPDFIINEITEARQKIEKEMELIQGLMKSLEEISDTLHAARLSDRENVFEILRIIGSPGVSYDKNIDLLSQLIKELEQF